jgi:hypothetical protein
MAVALVYGPSLPSLLGYREAIWGRGVSLFTPVLLLVLLLLPRCGSIWRSWLGFAGKAAIALGLAGVAFLAQWYTPLAPNSGEIAFAQGIYARSYVFLQTWLAIVWLALGINSLLRWRAHEQQLDLVPLLLGFPLAAFGAGIAFVVQIWLADPKLTGPWAVPVAAQKIEQTGEVGLGVMVVGMLVVACLPLARLIARAGWAQVVDRMGRRA